MLRSCVVIGLLAFAGFGLAAVSEEKDPGHVELSAELHRALITEMVAIDAAISSLASSIARGDWPAIRRESQKIHDSFILQQKLSEAELEELHQSLPPGFLELDSRFHQHAQQLAHVAEQGDSELAVFYFTKLVEGCIECHATYAADSFPDLTTRATEGHSH